MPRTRVALLLSLAVLPLLAVTACGSTTTTTTAGATTTTGAPGGADFAAYRQCLADHGVTVPDGGQRSDGAGPGNGAGQDNGGSNASRGGGGFGGPNSTDPTMQAAQDACKDLRPAGGPGTGQGGRGQGGQAIEAYRSCLKDHDVTVPDSTGTTTPDSTPGSASGGRFLGGLDQNDPTVAAALSACHALLPARPGGGSDSNGSDPTSTPGVGS